jgi:hypothetical protein
MNPKKLICLITALSFALIGMVATAAAAKAAGGGTNVPATTTFVSSTFAPAGQAIYADAYGSYKDGTYLDSANVTVTGISYVSGNSYFFRTVSSSGTTATNIRSVNMDFSQVVSGGVPAGLSSGASIVGDVRVLASSLFSAFARGATSGTTTVSMPFSLSPDFTGTSDFQLDFDAAVTVTGDSTTRTMTAGPNATATLSDLRGKRAVVVGKFKMPFSLTVSK